MGIKRNTGRTADSTRLRRSETSWWILFGGKRGARESCDDEIKPHPQRPPVKSVSPQQAAMTWETRDRENWQREFCF